LHEKPQSRRDTFLPSVIYEQPNQLESPVMDEGFNELIVKNCEQPRIQIKNKTKIEFFVRPKTTLFQKQKILRIMLLSFCAFTSADFI